MSDDSCSVEIKKKVLLLGATSGVGAWVAANLIEDPAY